MPYVHYYLKSRMKFCIVCNNMYYITIRSDKTDSLSYYCRSCGNIDSEMDEDVICVLNTQITKENPHFDQIVNKYTILDPTLPRIYNLPCPNKYCLTETENGTNKNTSSSSNEVLYILYNDNELKYLYMCCKFLL